MLGKQDLYQLVGATAYDRDGTTLGTVEAVYVDNEAEDGTFALVKGGLFGSRASFVPLIDANVRDGELHVAYPAEQVKDAPNLEAGEDLDATQELALYRHYGIPAIAGDDTAAAATPATGDELPTGADLIGDQGIDPTLDGPQVSAAQRLRLRRLGSPVSNAEDALLEHGEDQP